MNLLISATLPAFLRDRILACCSTAAICHLQRDFKPHFITFVTKFRRVLPDWPRDIVLSCCCHHHRWQYELYVAVVMPDHVHMILTPLIDQRRRQIFSLIDIMRGIKGSAARRINQQVGRHGAVWQEESFDQYCAARRGWMRRLSMFFRIRSGKGWSTTGDNIVGHGGGVGWMKRG
ncbi:MAG: transposase [Candidatus Sulfotelmatobacter sp.]